jgi:hypothetical protein
MAICRDCYMIFDKAGPGGESGFANQWILGRLQGCRRRRRFRCRKPIFDSLAGDYKPLILFHLAITLPPVNSPTLMDSWIS